MRVVALLFSALLMSCAASGGGGGSTDSSDLGAPPDITQGDEGECTPDCDGKECGDDGCGNSCGECLGNGSVCTNGQCVVECVPDCGAKDCGDDGCSGSCGNCATGDNCNAGVCETPAPVTYSKDVQPVFAGLCANCHKGSVPKACKGSTCLINFYSDTQKSSKSCGGKNVAECSLMRMKSGSMPPGPGKAPQSAIDIIQAWIDGGQLE
ncbi:MAG TPA: hypothetical protein EYN06_06015 [Myxococcales bacterium]|nr:hypothetical protein [Myxococcales bacterium]HIN86019.1 hypothetical protein [Myxococcales bacterium]